MNYTFDWGEWELAGWENQAQAESLFNAGWTDPYEAKELFEAYSGCLNYGYLTEDTETFEE